MRNWKKTSRSIIYEQIPIGAKFVKIGPANPEIICLCLIIKKEKSKKFMHAKYIARSAT